MRNCHGSLLLLLALASAVGASPPDVPAAVKAKPGQLVRVTVKADPDKLGHAKNFTDAEAFWGELAGPKGTRQFVFQAPLDGKRSSFVVGWWTDGELEGSTTTIEVDTGTAPIPPPKPVDPKTVDPPVPPVVSSFRVIFVYESSVTFTQPQKNVIMGKVVEDYLTRNTTGEGVWAGWGRFDKDVETLNGAPVMSKLWADVKPKLTVFPCMVVEVNGHADILNLPTNPADAIATLTKYSGKK